MADTNKIIEFFDSLADSWDDHMIIDDQIVECILDNAGVRQNKAVLDVACGTGVLFPYYLKRNVRMITGIDISPRMIEITERKFNGEKIKTVCSDATSYEYDDLFDCIVIYNAFPHFTDPDKLISHLCKYLNNGGTLTIAHGMSRERINAHHDNVMNVSNLLPDIDDMVTLFEKYLDVISIISDERMYLISGRKK